MPEITGLQQQQPTSWRKRFIQKAFKRILKFFKNPFHRKVNCCSKDSVAVSDSYQLPDSSCTPDPDQSQGPTHLSVMDKSKHKGSIMNRKNHNTNCNNDSTLSWSFSSTSSSGVGKAGTSSKGVSGSSLGTVQNSTLPDKVKIPKGHKKSTRVQKSSASSDTKRTSTGSARPPSPSLQPKTPLTNVQHSKPLPSPPPVTKHKALPSPVMQRKTSPSPVMQHKTSPSPIVKGKTSPMPHKASSSPSVQKKTSPSTPTMQQKTSLPHTPIMRLNTSVAQKMDSTSSMPPPIQHKKSSVFIGSSKSKYMLPSKTVGRPSFDSLSSSLKGRPSSPTSGYFSSVSSTSGNAHQSTMPKTLTSDLKDHSAQYSSLSHVTSKRGITSQLHSSISAQPGHPPEHLLPLDIPTPTPLHESSGRVRGSNVSLVASPERRGGIKAEDCSLARQKRREEKKKESLPPTRLSRSTGTPVHSNNAANLRHSNSISSLYRGTVGDIYTQTGIGASSSNASLKKISFILKQGDIGPSHNLVATTTSNIHTGLKETTTAVKEREYDEAGPSSLTRLSRSLSNWTIQSSTRKLSPKTKLFNLLSCVRRNRSKQGNSNMPVLYANHRSMSTQVSFDSIEAAYLNGGIVGLYNLGNTCYMNSMLQCLSHTLEMTDIFLCNRYTSGLSFEYRKAMCKIWFPRHEPPPDQSLTLVVLQTLKDHVSAIYSQFYGYYQHDAQEFLRVLMSSVHNEIRYPSCGIHPRPSTTGLSDLEQGKLIWKWYQSIDGSPLADVFMGQFKSSLQCEVCKNVSLTFDPFWDMALPVAVTMDEDVDVKCPVDLLSCLDLFTKDEILTGDNKPRCVYCQRNQPCVKKMTVQRFPPVLVFHLKRFNFTGQGYKYKLNVPVVIHGTLDLTSYASPETIGEYGGTKICYELYACSNHKGTLIGGHYTANVKHFATQKWYLCNDTFVTKVDEGPNVTAPEFISTEAYVLFYRRVIM